MTIEVKLPQWGMGMLDGQIVKWLKAEGEAVVAGEPIVEVEAAKVNDTVKAPIAGRLSRIIASGRGYRAGGCCLGNRTCLKTRRRTDRPNPHRTYVRAIVSSSRACDQLLLVESCKASPQWHKSRCFDRLPLPVSANFDRRFKVTVDSLMSRTTTSWSWHVPASCRDIQASMQPLRRTPSQVAVRRHQVRRRSARWAGGTRRERQ